MHLLSFSCGSVMQIWILYENEKCLKMNRQQSFASRWFTAMSFRMVWVHHPSRNWPYKRRKAIFLFTCEQIRCVTSQHIFWLHQDWWCVPVKPTSHNWLHTRSHVKLVGVSVVWYCCFFLDIMHGTIFFKMRCWHKRILQKWPSDRRNVSTKP